MTRFDEDFEGTEAELALWEANVFRSLQGRRGQQALREIEQALLAMEHPRLIEGLLQDEDGNLCLLGVFARSKGVDPASVPGWDEYDQTLQIGKKLKLTKTLTHTLAAANDLDGPYEETPEQRYQRVLSWVREEQRKEVA